MAKVRVWDLVVRITHWVVALGFVASLSTRHTEGLRHETAGLVTLLALTVRMVWGFIGSQHARYARFVASPDRALEYLIDLIDGGKRRYLGHNPLGAVMVVALHSSLILICVTGLLLYLDSLADPLLGASGFLIKVLHSTISTLALVMVAMHLLGVFWMSWLMRELLPWSMITGNKKAIDSGEDKCDRDDD